MTAPMRAVLVAHAAGWLAAGAAVCAALGAPWSAMSLGAVAAAMLWDATGHAVELGAALGSGPSRRDGGRP